MTFDLLFTFLCGAFYEGACVFWVACSEKGRPLQASFWSMIAAFVTCIGLGEALYRPPFIAAYVLGFGAGTFVAIVVKKKISVEMQAQMLAPDKKNGTSVGRKNIPWGEKY